MYIILLAGHSKHLGAVPRYEVTVDMSIYRCVVSMRERECMRSGWRDDSRKSRAFTLGLHPNLSLAHCGCVGRGSSAVRCLLHD